MINKKMSFGRRLFAAVVFILASAFAAASVPSPKSLFTRAKCLYDNGNYSQAGAIFSTIQEDPLSRDYSVLCSLKASPESSDGVMEEYSRGGNKTILGSSIHFEYALILFGQGRYGESLGEFSLVDTSGLKGTVIPEYVFKKAWCEYETGNKSAAVKGFRKVLDMPESEYTSVSGYAVASELYKAGEFFEAIPLFKRAGSDPSLTPLCEFYILDCEFNEGNYPYVLEHGDSLLANAPGERVEHIARILSESFLITGNNEKAKAYYELTSRENMNRKDFFYAGTVLYNAGDYRGAIDNYSGMGDLADSLGQIALYHLGNSYLKTGNQVAAMNSFRDASALEFDAKMTEDAYFNYAKLAFDLNKDTSVFSKYLKKYSTSKRGESIYGYIALAALYDGDYSLAVESYDNIDVLAPDMKSNYTKANYLRARQLVEIGAWSDAIPCLRASAFYLPKSDPFNQLSRYWIGECQYNTDNFDSALVSFRELYNASALDGKPEGNLLTYNIAYCLFRKGNYGEASVWFDRYIRAGSPEFRKDAFIRRADCDFYQKDYKSAVQSYGTAVAESGSTDDIYPYYRQALACGLSGDIKRKVSILSEVENSDKDAALYYDALYELGRAHMDSGNSEEALRVFRKLKDLSGDNSWKCRSLIGMGMVERNRRNYESALNNYKAVIDLMPDSQFSSDALLSIESIYRKMGKPQMYVEYVEMNKLASEKSEAEIAEMYFVSAEQLYLSGNWAEAVKALDTYLAKYPDTSRTGECLFYLGDSWAALGNKEKACGYLKVSARSENACRESATLKLADLLFGMDHFSEAYEYYRELLRIARLESNLPVARLGMMRSAFCARNYDDAITSARAVKADAAGNEELLRECDYVQAKSLMLTSRRDDALDVFRKLSESPSTPEGAEARYILIQDLEDSGRFEDVEKAVYDFSSLAGNQSYWLAKSFVTLGDSFAERNMYKQAKATFESVRDGYVPSGSSDDVIPNVNMRLDRLSKLYDE